MNRIAILVIGFYQHSISPYLPSACRFSPSCSHYSKEAIERYGLFKGGWLGVKRLTRCVPWGGAGSDRVP